MHLEAKNYLQVSKVVMFIMYGSTTAATAGLITQATNQYICIVLQMPRLIRTPIGQAHRKTRRWEDLRIKPEIFNS